jgi:hypothetical protein
LAGVYYIMLTVNLPFATASKHVIMLNNITAVIEVVRQNAILKTTNFSQLSHSYVTAERSILLQLAIGDSLVYHNKALKELLATFDGFLLYPK